MMTTLQLPRNDTAPTGRVVSEDVELRRSRGREVPLFGFRVVFLMLHVRIWSVVCEEEGPVMATKPRRHRRRRRMFDMRRSRCVESCAFLDF